MIRNSYPTLPELCEVYAHKYGVRWFHFWDCAFDDPEMANILFQDLGCGSGEREPADDGRISVEHRMLWIAVLGDLALRPLAAGDRYELRERCRVLNLTDRARAAGLV